MAALLQCKRYRKRSKIGETVNCKKVDKVGRHNTSVLFKTIQ